MNRPLRLLHVFPGFGFGGAELRVARLMNAMGNSVEHAVVALNGNTQASERVGPGVRLEFLAAPAGRGSLSYPLALRRLAGSWRPDVLATYNWGAMDAVLGQVLAPQCPVIHNECGFSVNEAARPPWRRVAARRIALNRIYRTVVVSQNLVHMCRTLFRLKPGKVQFIRTGVDLARFGPRPDSRWRERHGISAKELVLGFTGGLRPEKDLGVMIRAHAKAGLPGARLVLVGDGPERPGLEGLVSALGLGSSVLFTGWEGDVAEALAAFDVFLLSSATEQTPNAALEAMASGLPVILTDVGDCGEVLGEGGKGCLVPAQDVEQYATAMARLVPDETWRREAGARNRARVVAEYSEERMVKEYAALYFQAAGRQVPAEFRA